jgi:cellulose synthase/poly-beta-1,6-N-acetylglucosamine synthase-like glycosyltransferase
MDSFFQKILAVLLIFIAEAVTIYAEMLAARSKFFTSQSSLQIFLKMFLISIVGGGFLILGYMFGINNFKNIWIVSVISITSILIIEPVLAYAIFHQLPTRGAALGFIFGILGFVLALFIK